MIDFIKDILSSLTNSFNTKQNKGYSARKLSAFTLMCCIVWLHFKYVDNSNVAEIVVIDLCGVLILLGIVTAEHIIHFKNGKNNDEPR